MGNLIQSDYPYHWRFNSAIQLLFPGANYAATTPLTESATVHNQIEDSCDAIELTLAGAAT